MERSKKEITTQPQPIKLVWEKIGGGSLRWDNRIIKPGEKFEATLEELPVAFMDTLICLDNENLQKAQTAVKREQQTPETLYHLKKSKTSKGYWDVVNEEGKPLTDKPMEKESAEELLNAVNG